MAYLIFNAPYLIVNGEKTKINVYIVLSADNERKTTLWYEVSSAYSGYLYIDRMDPFLVAVLPYCMKNGYDIRFAPNAPGVSADLLYQLTKILIPSLKSSLYFSQIVIEAQPVYKPLKAGWGTATGVSGGVDSFYTILNHMEGLFPLTHLTLFNLQSFGEYGGAVARKHFCRNVKRAKKICEDLNQEYETDIQLITVDSNIQDELPIEIYYAGTYRDAGAILLLKQLFKLYYFSSTHGINDFSIRYEVRDYDLWNLSCLSTENCRIQIFGLDAERIDKLKYISEFPVTYDNLQICLQELLNGSQGMEYSKQKNCTCYCDKCVYMVLALKALGKLDKYETVFDLDLSERKYTDLLTEVITKKKSYLFKETYNLLRQTGEITEMMEVGIGASIGGYDDVPQDRDARLAEIFDVFLGKLQDHFSFSDALALRGYRSAAIYGMGRLGKRLYHELENLTLYGIDRNPQIICEGMEIKSPTEDLTPVDVIIITTVYDTEAIRSYLKNRVGADILTLKEILEWN